MELLNLNQIFVPDDEVIRIPLETQELGRIMALADTEAAVSACRHGAIEPEVIVKSATASCSSVVGGEDCFLSFLGRVVGYSHVFVMRPTDTG